jgi:hypothetical protein
VKTLRLRRVQVFDHSQGLVHDPRSIASSPSSTFLLIANNHQLIFLPRTPHAPTFKEFESTAKNFILKKYHAYIDRLFKEFQKSPGEFDLAPGRITKKMLYARYPMPNINVVPLADSGSIIEFVERFEKLISIDFKILRPNPAISAQDTFKDVRNILADLGADNAKLVAGNNKDGLDKSKAVNVITGAASGGNQEITLKGIDSLGANLSGSNEDFKLSVPLEPVPVDSKALTMVLYTKFKTYLQDDSTNAHFTEEHKRRLNRLASDL